MRKILVCLMIFAILLNIIPLQGNASEIKTNTQENGCYLKVEISAIYPRDSQRVNGTKTYTYYSADGEILWKVVLSGSFLYTGESATCTGSNCNVTIYNNNWYVVSKNNGMLRNQATAQLMMGRTLLGVPVEQKSINMVLTCDPNGNLS